jgi:fluoride exporter
MQAALVVFLGAGLGGALRHGVNLCVAWLLGTGFPVGTLSINVSGSLIMGLLAGAFAWRGDPGQLWRLFLTTGVLGGYTTFSTFSLDTVLLWQRGTYGLAILYVVGSVTASIGGLFCGLWAVRTQFFAW